MKPIKFKEVNKILMGEDSTVGDLPVFADGKQCLSCWKMNFRERLKALVWGKIWLCVLMPKGMHPPVWLICDRRGFEQED